jgi:hypothetical protein
MAEPGQVAEACRSICTKVSSDQELDLAGESPEGSAPLYQDCVETLLSQCLEAWRQFFDPHPDPLLL